MLTCRWLKAKGRRDESNGTKFRFVQRRGRSGLAVEDFVNPRLWRVCDGTKQHQQAQIWNEACKVLNFDFGLWHLTSMSVQRVANRKQTSNAQDSVAS